MAKRLKVTKNNYYSSEANNAYWSASLVKQFFKCPAAALAELRGEYVRPKSPALLVGSYVDSYFEGKKSFSNFCAEHASEIYKAQTKKQAEEGTPKQKYADFQKADEMIDRCTSDPVFMEYMHGQKQKIITGTIAGIPVKAKLDVYLKDERIVDLKTCRDFQPVYVPGQGKLNFVDAYEYGVQLAIYRELVRQNTDKVLPAYLACVTKEDPPDIAVIELSSEKLDAEFEYLEEKLPRFDAMKSGLIEANRCENCAYCRATRKLNKPILLEDFFEGD